jgi:gluconate:H+ symporter, GntP family
MVQFSLIVFAIILLVFMISYLKINAFLSLFCVAIGLGLVSGMDASTLITAIKSGFGHTMEKIGLLIIFGVILGEILEKSHATEQMAHYILKKVGIKNTPLAIILIGFLVGLPIFCDSGFIILSGLLFSLRKSENRMPLIICLAGSLYAVHCLVPPHPGILAATSKLNADLGLTMLLGICVAIVPTTLVFYYAKRFESKAFPEQNIMQIETKIFTNKTWQAFLPLWLPIALMALKAVLNVFYGESSFMILSVLKFCGEPIMALLIGVLVAIPLLGDTGPNHLNRLFNNAFAKSGHILAIVAAGGIFGEIVKITLEKIDLNSMNFSSTYFWIFIPFLLTFFFKSAQGSSTVAILSAVSILEPFMIKMGIDSTLKTELFILAMGAGSMMISHANDAYFWVVTNFSKITEEQAFKNYTPMSILMGTSTIVVLWLISIFV